MTKGIAGIIIIAALALALTGAIFIAGFIGTQKSFAIVSKETTILKTIDQVESIKQFLNTSLWYSFSQAIYDVSKQGGHYHDNSAPKYNGVYYWRVDSSKYFPNYLGSIEKATLDILNRYTNSLKISSFSSVSVDKSKGIIYAKSKKPIERIVRGNTIELAVRDMKNVTAYFNPDVFEVYDRAKSLYIDSNVIKNAIDNSIDGICNEINVSQECSDNPSSFDEDFHDIYCSDWKSQIEDKIKSAIKNLDGVYGNVKITHEIKDIDVWYHGYCDYDVGINEEKGIAICINSTDSYNCYCSDTPCCENPTKTISCYSCGYATCKENYYDFPKDCHCNQNPYYYCKDVYSYSTCGNYTNIKCYYKNHAKVMVLVKLQYPLTNDISSLFPVYDGNKTKCSKIVLQFYVNTTV